MKISSALLAACLIAAACSPPVPDDNSVGWSVVQQGEALGGPILAVWGASDSNVMFVGGSVGNGQEALVWRWDGSAMRLLHPGGSDTLWWLHGTSASDVWMVGEHGRITHFDGVTFTESPRPVDTTLWAVVAFAPDDVFAVGGMPGRPNGSPNDVVLHFDGVTWTQEMLPMPKNVALLKAWGTSANDLYAVGEQGVIWHRSSAGWELQSALHTPRLTDGTLFSVTGCSATEVYAAGGTSLLKSNGSTWERVDEPALRIANGLSCRDGHLTIVGFSGLKVRRDGDGSHDDTRTEPFANLHAAWTDSTGAVWAVGGDWVSAAATGAVREGMVARYGRGHVKAELVK